jgi:hypothetical protein
LKFTPALRVSLRKCVENASVNDDPCAAFIGQFDDIYGVGHRLGTGEKEADYHSTIN